MVNVLFIDGFLAEVAFSVVVSAFLGVTGLLGSLIQSVGGRWLWFFWWPPSLQMWVFLLGWQFVALSYIEDQSPQESARVSLRLWPTDLVPADVLDSSEPRQSEEET
jgi:hypothetical protein